MLRAVVIPAAGAGTRLRARTGEEIPKALLPVAGKPLVVWNLEGLRDLGVHRIWVVTGAHHIPFLDLVTAFGVTLVHHRAWKRGNGDSLRVGLEVAFREHDEVGVLMSDHLYAPGLLEEFVTMEGGEKSWMWVDAFVEAIWDLPDGMKVRLDPPGLSKAYRQFDGVDIGMFRLRREILPFFQRAAREGRYGISDALEAAMRAGYLGIRWVREGGLWLDVDTPEALQEAERRLATPTFSRFH